MRGKVRDASREREREERHMLIVVYELARASFVKESHGPLTGIGEILRELKGLLSGFICLSQT